MTNNNKSMNIVEYLKSQSINFVFGKTDKDKGFMFLPNNEYGNNINQSKLLFEKNQDYIEKTMKTNMGLYKMGQDYNTAFIDTNEFIQLDCDIKDDEEYSKLSQEGITMLNNLQTNYPYYKSATKKYGFHFILGKTCDIEDKKLLEVLKNNSSICEYSNWSNDKPCEKLNSDYGFLEIFCGTPIWCKTFENIKVDNANKKLTKTNTKTNTTKIFKNMLNEKFIKNKGKVKQAKQVDKIQQINNSIDTSNINNIKIDTKFDYNIEVIKGIPTDKYIENGYVFKLLIHSIWDKGDIVKQTLYDLGKKSKLAVENYDTYFNNIYEEGQNRSQKQSFGYAVNMCDSAVLYKLKIMKNRTYDYSNEKISIDFMDIYEDSIIQVKYGETYNTYLYNNDRWSNQTAQKFCSMTDIIREFTKKYLQDLITPIQQKINQLGDSENEEDIEELKKLTKLKDNIEIKYNIQKNKNTDCDIIINMINQKRSRFKTFAQDIFDKKTHLLPFNNCVYNLNPDKKLVGKELNPKTKLEEEIWEYDNPIEEHTKNNFITKYINYDLPKNDKKINDYIEDFTKMYDGLFTEEYKPVQEDFTFILALGLTGTTSVFLPIFNGVGSNGKSVIFDYMELILGNEYFIRFCGDMIGEDIKANKPSPEWANIGFKRFGVFTETKEGTQINMATAKNLGEGTITSRMLYSNDTKIYNYANYAVMCNEKPTIMGVSDNSLNRRIRDIRLPRVFVEKKTDPRLKQNNDIYKLAETKYSNKSSTFVIENMKIGMLFYLINYIENFEEKYGTTIFEIGQKFPFSDLTMKNSQEYIKSEDIIADFINEYLNLELQDDPNYNSYYQLGMDYVSGDELYNKFTGSNYYKTLEQNDKKNYSRKSFINNLKNSCFTSNYYKREITRNKIKLTGKGGYLNKVYYKVEIEPTITKKIEEYNKHNTPNDSDNEEEESENTNQSIPNWDEEDSDKYESD
jgi:hypothetical protein